MEMWVATYYVAGRFSGMMEKTRIYPGDLTKEDAHRKVENFLTALRLKGTNVYPQFDLHLEKLAA